MNKYEQLKVDLIEAVARAKEKAMQIDDGGTCNFDCCILYLSRCNEEKTIEAIKEAGIDGFKTSYYGRVCYMLGIPVAAQGDRRTEQAEEIYKAMTDKGYNASVYYQMD